MTLARPAAALLMTVLSGMAATWCATAGAQQIFRIVGPDGRVTFSDRPPSDVNAKASPATVVNMGGNEGNAALPFELRAAANRYPVTLYTAAGCNPCAAGRSFLMARGIPFSEKTVASNEDIEALKRMAGGTTVPFLTIGAQQLKGYSEAEWTQFLDAAGYPKTSQLPAAYRQPQPSPLVAVQAPQRPAQQAEQQQPQTPATPSTPTPPPENPAGIRF